MCAQMLTDVVNHCFTIKYLTVVHKYPIDHLTIRNQYVNHAFHIALRSAVILRICELFGTLDIGEAA